MTQVLMGYQDQLMVSPIVEDAMHRVRSAHQPSSYLEEAVFLAVVRLLIQSAPYLLLLLLFLLFLNSFFFFFGLI